MKCDMGIWYPNWQTEYRQTRWMNFSKVFERWNWIAVRERARQPLYVRAHTHNEMYTRNKTNAKKNHICNFSLFDPLPSNTQQFRRKRRRKKQTLRRFENDIIPWLGRMWCDIEDTFFPYHQQFACVCFLVFFSFFFFVVSFCSLSAHRVCWWLSTLFIYTSIFTFIFVNQRHIAHYYLFTVSSAQFFLLLLFGSFSSSFCNQKKKTTTEQKSN